MADTLNEQNSVTLTFSAGNDSVDNRGYAVTVDGAGGNDILINGRYWESERGGSNVSIVGGTGNDTIISHGLKSFLDGDADDDLIYNGYRYYEPWNAFYDPDNENYNGSNSTISGNSGNDSIKNIGQKVSINAGAGNDSIYNYGDSVTIEAGTGNDSIYNYGSSVTIDGGSGNDDIRSFVSNVSINGGDGNNLIISSHRYEYVDGDVVTERAQSISIRTGAGNDSIYNYGDSVTIESGAGNDSIDNGGSSVTIDTGTGDDIIHNWDYSSGNYSNSVKISGGAGNDSVNSHADFATINGDSGKDSVENYGHNVTIDAGTDDDYIFNEGDLVTIDAGAGDDTIYNGDNTKFQYIKYMEGGSNVTIKGGSGNDYIYSNVDSVTIDGGDGNNYIKNDFTWEVIDGKAFYKGTKNVAIKTGSGDDTIYNSGDSMTIDVGDGKDSVRNFGSFVTINAGAGNNMIRSGGNDVLVLLNGGKNIVEGDVTIRLGKDNGTLTGDNDAQIYQYAASDGDYVITNYSGEDMIHITSGKVDSYSFDGGDLIFHIGNGSLCLKNMTNHAITVKDSSGKTTTQIYSNGYSPQQVIKNLVKAWNKTLLADKSTAKLDESIQLCSQFKTIQEVIDKMVADCRKVNDAESFLLRDNPAVFLRDYCGINLDNDDTGAITGWNAGGLSIKTASDIVGETLSSLKHVSDYTNTTFKTSQGVAINLSSTGDTLTSDGKKVFDALYSWWAEEALNLIEESYGVEFKDGDEINIALTPSASYSGVTRNGKDVTINIDSAKFANENDYNGGGIDRTIAHEFTHVAQSLFMGSFPQFLQEGLADLTGGCYGKEDSIYRLASNADSLSTYLSLKNYGTGSLYHYAAGFMFYRYLVKQVSDSYDSSKSYAWKDGSSITGTTDAELLTGNAKKQTIRAGAGNDTITAYGEKMKIFGDDGDDYILTGTNAKNLTISAGKGNDSVFNESSQVTISSDVGNDTIRNYGGNVSIVAGSDNDSIYSSGNSVIIDGGKGNDTITSCGANNVSINAGEGNDVINGDLRSSTTVTGGKGNDTIELYSTGKNRLIQYREGDDNDVIFYFGTTDTLQIGDGSDTYSTHVSGSDIIVTVGEETITLVDVASLSAVNIVGNEIFKPKWTLNGSVATYGTPNETLIIISGVKSLDGISLNDKVVTVSKSALGTNDVTISEGYSLTLYSDVIEPITTPAAWSTDDYKVIYKSASNTAGYSLSNDKKSITYTPAVTESDLFSLSNVKNTDSISVDTAKKTVTLNADNLTGKNVSITGDYSLALSGVNPPSSTAAHFSGLTYKSASNTAGYSLSSDKKSIFYTPAVPESNLFTLSNVKNTDSIVVNTANKTVTLNADNLTGKNVSITGDYSLKLGNDVPTSTTKTAGSFTKFANGTATFKISSFSDFYSLKNNQVTYTAPSGGKTISIKNLKSSATLDAVKSGIIVSEQKNGSCKITFKSSDLLTTKAPVISATDVTYTVVLDKSLKPAALAPDWKVSGTNASLKSDTSAGYTVSDNKILYSKKVTGSPRLVLGGLLKNSSLSAPVKKVVTLDSKVLGKNASLKSNVGSYTVKLTGNLSKKTFTASAYADSLNIAANNAAVLGDAGNDSFTVSGSKVTLTGGKGNDSFKLSGKNPVLIYGTGDGNDTVNFVAGMQISLTGSTQIKTLGKSGSDLLLGFGKNSSVKITSAKSSDTLKVSNASGSVTLVAGKFDLADSLTFNSKNSSVKVAKNFSGSLAPSNDIYLGGSKLSSVATINASNVTSKITISGNDKANTISAGKNNDIISGGNGNDSIVGNAGNDKLYGQNGNDSLWGGKGNDSLWGGDGKDVFIYSAGKDIIADFTAGQDKIKIASGKISKSSLSGSDVIFTIGKGSLTVKNAKGKTISLIDSTGKASSTVVGAQTLTNSNKANVTIATDTGVVDASKRTKAIQITGNALANSISGGSKNDSIYGGAGNDSIVGNAGNDKLYGQDGNDILKGGKGNDSLWGGKGNDSLWGDAGNDTFIYTANEGTDKIFDYSTGDILKILNVDGSNGSFKSSKFSGADLTLTINSGGKIIFEDVSASTKFNINGSSYIISGSKLFKK